MYLLCFCVALEKNFKKSQYILFATPTFHWISFPKTFSFFSEADELLATEALKNKEIEKDNNSDKASHYVVAKFSNAVAEILV